MTTAIAASLDGSYGSLLVGGSEKLRFGGDTSGQPFSFRNKIINGNFDFWQRGTSSNIGGYLADRWVNDNSGTRVTASQGVITLGQTEVPNYPRYFHRSTVASVAGANNYAQLSQRIENVETFNGSPAVLTFWAKADSPKNIAIEFVQYFGTDGSTINTGIGVTKVALTTNFQKFTVPVNIPSVSGKVRGSDNADLLGVVFWFDAGSNLNKRTASLGQQSGVFDIAQVQFEAGSIPTPFDLRPPSVEWGMCKRYYHRITPDVVGAPYGIGRGPNTSICDAQVLFLTPMRDAPVLEQTGKIADYGVKGNTIMPCNTLPVLMDSFPESVILRFTVNNSLIAGNPYYNVSNSDDSFIAFSAELYL